MFFNVFYSHIDVFYNYGINAPKDLGRPFTDFRAVFAVR